MGLDFDALEYCKNLKIKQSHPPYSCPVSKCDRSYKTVIGLQYHLQKFDHDNPQPITPVITPNRKKARSRGAKHSTPKGGTGAGSDDGGCGINGTSGTINTGKHTTVNPETLVTYNEEEHTVQFNIDGKSVRLGIDDPLPFIEDDEYEDLVTRGCILNADAPPVEENAAWARVKVPEARYLEIEDYNVPDAPGRPLAYYRFIEKSAEELDGEIEYDVDEEDTAWLEWMNGERDKTGLNGVSIDTMELLMDRLEKESYFQAAANGTATGVEVDDDAVCCICMDGECQNTNVILFCDMCNLAVHQDCYGVPYIPEGQWLCRRCLQSPSTPVNCVLCPNAGGAFKQTDRGQWAHVVCALWIPEVRFANTVFLEPIDSIETIPVARWRLTCYICKEKGLGACIQCQRNSCYAAFHVTCAQQAGLYMTMDTVKDGHNDSSMHVQKYAYCHAHTPVDAKLKTNQKEVEDTRHKMKEARKALAKKRSSAPIVLIPTIPPDRVQEIAGMVHMQKKSQFLDRLIAYWTLKRQFRNGVPLLRRLQSQGNHHGVIHRNGIEGSPDANELYKQLKYWQCLRQDLERARLLCELVRKREKLKAAYVKICEQVTLLELNPLESALTKLLDALEARDTAEIFREPVDTDEVPDYLDIVKHPMDLGTMRDKLKRSEYGTLEQLEVDFDLMIQNCLAYNNKDTVFYRAGIRMRDQAAPLIQQVREELKREGLLDTTKCAQRDHVEEEVEEELKQLLAGKPAEDIVQKLLILADKSQVLKNPTYRTKKIKQIRVEIARMRKAIQKARVEARYSRHNNSQTDDDEQYGDVSTVESETSLAKKLKEQQEKLQQQQYQTPRRSRRPTVTAAPNNYVVDDDEDDDDVEEEDDEEEEDEDDTMGEESKATTIATQTPPCSPIKSLNNSASPVGVNRRTAVLFTRKAQAALKRPSETTPVKEEHTPSAASLSTSLNNSLNNSTAAAAAAAAAMSAAAASLLLNSNKLGGSTHHQHHHHHHHHHHQHNQQHQQHQQQQQQQQQQHQQNLSGNLNSNSAVKSPKRNARHKRLTADTLRNSASMSPKKSPNPLGTPTITAPITSTPSGDALSYERIPDSFRVYRANNERDVSESDDDDLSDISGSPCSSCSEFSISGSGSEYDSSDIDDDEMSRPRRNPDDDNDDDAEEDGNKQAKNDVEDEDDNDDDDDDEEEEDEGDEDDDGDGDDDGNENENHANNEDDDGDANMRDLASGNGDIAPMSCSDGSQDEEENTTTNKKSKRKTITTRRHRTPTPAEKHENANKSKNSRTKQKRKGKTTTTAAATTTTPVSPSKSGKTKPSSSEVAIETSPPTITTTNTTLTNSKGTRATNKMQTRAATPTAALVNNSKSKKSSSSLNHKHSKLNNVNSTSTPTATPPPQPPTTTQNYSDNMDDTTNNADDANSELLKPPLEPLQLVWAKCRGYPWYPALILDPKTPKGFVYNGVPLPAPPQDVLALRKNCTDDIVYLVLFFDAKRTWQWLPANKLEILGIDKQVDQAKLVESRKPTERKAVKKAYQDALHYQSQVSDLEGQGPDPIM